MARPAKLSLQYFTLDVGFLHDRKIRRLARKYARGVEFYLHLLCCIYGDRGYYMEFDDGTYFDLAELMRLEEEEVREMIAFCTAPNIALFDRKMFDQYGILTSCGIQRRYISAIRELKRKVSLDAKYNLISSEDSCNNDPYFPEPSEETPHRAEETEENRIITETTGVSSQEMELTPNKLPLNKSKEKESKEKESKEKEIKFLSSAHAREEGGVSAAEREDFFEIFFFKNFLYPTEEVDRFIDYYAASGWRRAGGQIAVDREALARMWLPKNKGRRFDPVFLEAYKALVLDMKNHNSASAHVLVHGLHGVEADAGTVAFICSGELREVIESNVAYFREIFYDKVFPGRKLIYKIKKDV